MQDIDVSLCPQLDAKTANEVCKEKVMNISEMCRDDGVSRSGYYRRVSAAEKRAERERWDGAEFALLQEAYNYRGYPKGARTIQMCMLHWSEPVVMNLKKIRRLMAKYGLQCPIPRRIHTAAWQNHCKRGAESK